MSAWPKGVWLYCKCGQPMLPGADQCIDCKYPVTETEEQK